MIKHFCSLNGNIFNCSFKVWFLFFKQPPRYLQFLTFNMQLVFFYALYSHLLNLLFGLTCWSKNVRSEQPYSYRHFYFILNFLEAAITLIISMVNFSFLNILYVLKSHQISTIFLMLGCTF